MEKEITRDCRYCSYAECCSDKDETVYCWLDIGEHIENPIKEAEKCSFFEYDDTFPKS